VDNDEQSTASVPGRYASALFELARDQKQVAAVEADLGRFEGLLAESADLRRLVVSPVFSGDEQSKAMTAVLAKAGIGGTAGNFLRLLAKNRRLFAAADMIKAFRAIAARERGEVVADVTSAHPLTDAQAADLKSTLQSFVARQALGRDVVVHAKVDPSLLGGLVVKVGSRMIDSSLKTKLSTLKVAMKGTG
jgi:F-type H+-transporting ATPase subunit delta